MIIERAKKSAQDENVPNCLFEVCKGEDMTEIYEGSFDIVFMMDVLHDLSDPDRVMASVKKVLKPGGYLIAIDPAMHSDHKDNVGNIAVGGYYFVSMFVCLPSSLTRDPKVGHGLGWGYENRKSYIEKCGFRLRTLTEEEDMNEMKNIIIGKMM
ncbi:hypothetical protein FSP39_024408 [Pinctada imbricata]|uniref:Methyltransferase domain-containing protein n=1 Tax=Pinctada imbricata TaxID=66713 RepID=A0AA88XY73_PINIB|nr:hypothetical protein FSP39_024408 [Pinctada imbricata]